MSLSVLLTELQPMHSCLSRLLAQPDRQPAISSSLLAPSACTLGPRGPQTLSTAPPPGSSAGSFVLDDLRRYSVDLHYTVFQTTGSVPISTVIVNETSGSRTILHAHRFVHRLRLASCRRHR